MDGRKEGERERESERKRERDDIWVLGVVANKVVL